MGTTRLTGKLDQLLGFSCRRRHNTPCVKSMETVMQQSQGWLLTQCLTTIKVLCNQWASDFHYRRVIFIKQMPFYCQFSTLLMLFIKINVQIKGLAKLRIVQDVVLLNNSLTLSKNQTSRLNPYSSKIRYLILSTDHYTFTRKLVQRIWCYMK